MEICIKWTMCRTCTNDSSTELQSLFDDFNLVKQLQEYAGVSVQADDGLPDQICVTCVENLQLVDSFVSGCKRADEQLRNVVRRTMSTGNTFQNHKTEADLPKEPSTKVRTRKQLISVRNLEHIKQYSKDISKSLIRKNHETPEIYVENETVSPVDSKEDLELITSLDPSEVAKNNEAYLLVVDKLKLGEDETSDNESNEYILADVGNENDDYDDIVSTIETDEKLLSGRKFESSSVFSQSQLDSKNFASVLDPGTVSHAIDLGAACEPSSFTQHSCSFCGNTFQNQTQLNSHMRLHVSTRNYECELCTKRFSTAGNLTIHMRTHTGEKPYECTHCGRRFADRSTHRKHERMHTNERPYACNICGKNFSLSSTLKAHFLSHSKEKPHKCLTCNKGFRLPHQLKAHEKTHVHRYEMGVMLYNQDEGDYSSS